jgi:hypothetical protein
MTLTLDADIQSHGNMERAEGGEERRNHGG